MRGRWVVPLVALVVSGCGSGPVSLGSTTPGTADIGPSVLVVAAGDIACAPDREPASGGPRGEGAACQQAATAGLITDLGAEVSAVLALGDLQYQQALLSDFEEVYEPTWGVVKDQTYPVPGNHEYQSGAEGYFAYWGDRAGSPSQGWYSFDVGSWHLVALNSNCGAVGGCETGSPQQRWLAEDLAAHPAPCTLAFMHHPRFTTGEFGPDDGLADLWSTLDDGGVELVLAGHDHIYARFGPRRGDGAPAADGVRQFVVGTGGKAHYDIDAAGGAEAYDNTTFGVLALELGEQGYRWRFLGAGGDYADEGSDSCRD